jgi:hypothetical protein
VSYEEWVPFSLFGGCLHLLQVPGCTPGAWLSAWKGCSRELNGRFLMPSLAVKGFTVILTSLVCTRSGKRHLSLSSDHRRPSEVLESALEGPQDLCQALLLRPALKPCGT